MTPSVSSTTAPAPPAVGPSTRAGCQARAYCGPAHGHGWTVDPTDPQPVVQLTVGAVSLCYRLIVHPRTHQPARDHQGRLLYMPVRHQPEPVLLARDGDD